MWSLLKRTGIWLADKFAGLILILVLGVATSALWLFLQDKYDYEVSRENLLRTAQGQRTELLAARDAAEQRIRELQNSEVTARQREQQAGRLLEKLGELDGGWWALWRDTGERESLARRKEQVATIRREAAARAEELQRQVVLEGYKRAGIEIALEKSGRNVAALQRTRSRALHYLDAAWERVCWHVLAVVCLWFFGPPIYKLVMYYGVAPHICRQRGVKLSDAGGVLPAASQSDGVLDVGLWPGEVLRVREEVVRGSDEGLTKKGRWVFDWSMPLACFATGLTDLVEMKHSHAGQELRVSLGGGEQPMAELAVVEIPEGSSIVLRPSFILGVILPFAARLKIRRRWVLHRWISWITGQIRYYEFVGPCRVILSGAKGVRAELIEPREGGAASGRRTQSELLVGFSPALHLQPTRTETFWAYLRGRRALFDCVFSGSGVFLVQGKKPPSTGVLRERWASRWWDAALRLVGM